MLFRCSVYLLPSSLSGCDGLLADEAVVLVVGVVLGVPGELAVEVHVEVGLAVGVVGLVVGVAHLGTGQPLEGLVPVVVKA